MSMDGRFFCWSCSVETAPPGNCHWKKDPKTLSSLKKLTAPLNFCSEQQVSETPFLHQALLSHYGDCTTKRASLAGAWPSLPLRCTHLHHTASIPLLRGASGIRGSTCEFVSHTKSLTDCNYRFHPSVRFWLFL